MPWTLIFKSPSSSKEIIKHTRAQKLTTLDSLPEGSYLLSYFKDDNRNQRWDRGKINPWTSQEAIGKIADTLIIEAGEMSMVTIEWPPIVSK